MENHQKFQLKEEDMRFGTRGSNDPARQELGRMRLGALKIGAVVLPLLLLLSWFLDKH